MPPDCNADLWFVQKRRGKKKQAPRCPEISWVFVFAACWGSAHNSPMPASALGHRQLRTSLPHPRWRSHRWFSSSRRQCPVKRIARAACWPLLAQGCSTLWCGALQVWHTPLNIIEPLNISFNNFSWFWGHRGSEVIIYELHKAPAKPRFTLDDSSTSRNIGKMGCQSEKLW